MKKGIFKQITEYSKPHRRKKKWQVIVTCLAAVVVFCTTYALILPAITMERSQHNIPICSAETLNLHKHTDSCRNESGELICGYSDFVVHEHNSSCYDEQGNLWCFLPEIKAHKHTDACFAVTEAHTHTENCYTSQQGALICNMPEGEGHTHSGEAGCFDETGELTCQVEDSTVHWHTDECYVWDKVLNCAISTERADTGEQEPVCGKEEIILHEHSSDCFDEGGNLICEQVQVLEHIHSDACFQTEEAPADTEALTGQIPEEEEHKLLTAPYGAVIAAYAVVEENVSTEQDVLEIPAHYAEDGAGSPRAGEADLADTKLNAEIWIDNQKYDESTSDPVDKTKPFTVKLSSEAADNALSYYYKFPSQIKVENTGTKDEPLILYDGEGENRKQIGSYYIKDGVLYVNYENSYNKVISNFEITSNWAEDVGDRETIKWSDELQTDVTFLNKNLRIEKTDGSNGVLQTAEDGGLYIEYTVKVDAESGGTLSITDRFRDNVSSGTYPNVTELWKDAYGEGADYQLIIYTHEGENDIPGSTQCGRFEVKPNTDTDGKVTQNGQTLTTGPITLNADQFAELKYKVKVSPEYRAQIDGNNIWLSLTNEAMVQTTPAGSNKPITSSTTHNATYSSSDGWIKKTHESPGEGSDDGDGWAVTVNPNRQYSMEGFVLLDNLQAGAEAYVAPFTVDVIGENQNAKASLELTVIDLSQNDGAATIMSWLYTQIGEASGIEEIAILLSDPYVQSELRNIGVNAQNAADLSKYVFVDNNSEHNYNGYGISPPIFLWISPPDGAVKEEYGEIVGTGPYSYTARYHTKSSNGSAAGTVNSAQAYWRGIQSGTGPVISDPQVNLEKSNDGVYTGEDGGLYVDWNITVTVPENSSALRDVWLVDTLPTAKVNVSGQQYDTLPTLKGLSSDTLDAGQIKYADKKMTEATQTYLKQIADGAFTITGTGSGADPANGAEAMLGAPEVNLDNCFMAYQGAAAKLGTMHLTGYDGYSSVSPRVFSIHLGNLPETKDEGYTITVTYTTKVNPNTMPLATQDYVVGVNKVALYSKLDGINNTKLADAHADYWLAKQKAEDSVLKNIVNYDTENRILTYRVEINPLNNLEAGYLSYVLNDTLHDYQGAQYIENSFKLYVHGSVIGGKYDQENSFWQYDKGVEHLIWASDSKSITEDSIIPNDRDQTEQYKFKTKALYEWLTKEHEVYGADGVVARYATPVELAVDNDKGEFGFTLNNVSWMSTANAGGAKVVPMTLEYQVQLPEESPGGSTVINNQATLSARELPNPTVSALIGISWASYDTQNILNKALFDSPNETNGYTAQFRITVSKKELEEKMQENSGGQPVELKEIVIRDTLQNLSMDTTTAVMEGYNSSTGQWVKLTSGPDGSWTLGVDLDDSNKLTVTIRNVDDEEKMPYSQYRLTYSARVVGTPETTVDYSNTADIDVDGVLPAKVEEEVYIKKTGGSATVSNISLIVNKVDGNSVTQGLAGVEFDLYVYNDSEWQKESTEKLITDESGKLELTNAKAGVSLHYNKWYCLVETKTQEEYRLGGPRYFYIMDPDGETQTPVETPSAGPGGLRWTSERGWMDGDVMTIYNNKPYFRVEKHDANTGKIITDGVEFTLYSDKNCTQKVKTVTSTNGTFDFSDLTKNTIYYLKETKVPEGYQNPNVVYEIVIDQDGGVQFKDGSGEVQEPLAGHTYTFKVDNTPKEGYELPMTGGFGTLLCLFCGSVLMLVVVMYLIRGRLLPGNDR